MNWNELEFGYDEIIWPYFGSILAIIHAPDTPECRQVSDDAVTITVRFPVESLEDFSSPDGSSPTLTQFKIIVDYIATPARNKRLLFD